MRDFLTLCRRQAPLLPSTLRFELICCQSISYEITLSTTARPAQNNISLSCSPPFRFEQAPELRTHVQPALDSAEKSIYEHTGLLASCRIKCSFSTVFVGKTIVEEAGRSPTTQRHACLNQHNRNKHRRTQQQGPQSAEVLRHSFFGCRFLEL